MKGTLYERREGLKTHWRNLSARARLGECFGFIDAITVIYKTGHITKELALELLNRRASADEIREYRRVRQVEPLT